jgi:hypothetical protein
LASLNDLVRLGFKCFDTGLQALLGECIQLAECAANNEQHNRE